MNRRLDVLLRLVGPFLRVRLKYVTVGLCLGRVDDRAREETLLQRSRTGERDRTREHSRELISRSVGIRNAATNRPTSSAAATT